ncbi:MAG: hypothetical protein K2H85_06935, partial [Allobaculum sp.]|nr:hypothetical protein [Allobaculum sp.]
MKLSSPVNVWPENIDDEIRKHFLKEVTSPMMYESSTRTFHPDGLYSELIFGQIGSPARIGTLAYIDLHCTVLEPLVYLNVVKLASWYQDIMESRTWAVWDDKIKDFTPSDKDEPDANTGFAFFLDHVKDIHFEFNSSRSRANRIKSVQKYFESGCAFKTKCLVAPAGWRDVKINDNGRDEVDEVNKLYTSLLIMSREVKADIVTPELIPFFNSAKYHIQLKVVEIFEYWKNFWEGKGGYGQSRYNKRMLALGTRNVIASATLQADSPKDPRYIKHNDTQTPIFVAAKLQEPVVVHALNRLFFSSIYTLGSIQIPAIDPKTLEIVYIEVPAADVTYALNTKSK